MGWANSRITRPGMGANLEPEARLSDRAFFILLGVFLWATCNPIAEAKPRCTTDRVDERVGVSHVYDGDTLTLRDGRRLRLIGADAPEMGRDGNPSEPMAIAARDYLRRLIFSGGQRLELHYDKERQDRYGRTLAHAFLSDGTSITASLLGDGYARHLAVPPNLWLGDCYQAASADARTNQLGIWALERYQVRESASLSPRTRGFNVVAGSVTRIGKGQANTWINLQGQFALRIEKDDLGYFKDWDFSELVGQRLEAAGWVYQRKGQLRMQVRHPSALRKPIGPAG
jgi:micrococcal nuclease